MEQRPASCIASIFCWIFRGGQARLTPSAAVFSVLFLLACVTRAIPAVNVIYSVDDYVHAQAGAWSTLATQYLQAGRPTSALIAKAFSILGLERISSGPWGIVVYNASLAALAISVLRIWRIPFTSIAAYIVGLIVVLHPYNVELATFAPITGVVGVGYMLCAFALRWAERTDIWFAAGIGVFSLSLGVYQICLNFLLVVWLIACVLKLLQQPKNLSIFQCARDFPWRILMLGLVGTLCYLGLSKIVLWITGMPAVERAVLIDIEQIPSRIAEVVNTIVMIIGVGEPHRPLLPVIAPAMGLCVLILLFSHTLYNRYWSKSLSLIIALGLASAASVGVTAVAGIYWPVPRALASACFLWAGVWCVGFHMFSGLRLRATVLLGVLLVAVFAFSNSKVLIDQLRMNARDAHFCSRIIARLEATPGFSGVRRIAVIGGPWTYESRISTTIGDMNISSRMPPQTRVPMLNEISGYDFAEASSEEISRATDYARAHRAWPDIESILIDGELAIILFPQ